MRVDLPPRPRPNPPTPQPQARMSAESCPSMLAAPTAAAPAASVETLALAPAASVAAAAPRASVTAADLAQLLRSLALDRGIATQPQPDPTALTVHLDDCDVELVALLQHVLDGPNALARLHVRDV